MSTEETTQKAETAADYGKDQQGLAKRWQTAINMALKERKPWHAQGDKLQKRYRDERTGNDESKRYNILWSNLQILQPSLYAQAPTPIVGRRYKDKDPIGREASEILERAAEYALDEQDFDEVMESCVQDRLLPGLGVARVDYKPFFTTKTDDQGQPYEAVAYETAPVKYTHWKDFLHGPARVWADVPWVAYRSFMTREELVKRFGSEIGNKVKLDYKPKHDDEEAAEQFKKAQVWEVWDKQSKRVIWISLYHPVPLDVKNPYLKLSDFFPSPKPLLATTTTDKLIPVPDYIEYQDQADELDVITQRINLLVQALRVAGVYDAENAAIANLLNSDARNQLIPVDNWAAFAGKGGLDGAISWLPIEQIVKVLAGLYEARESIKQDLYEITGLSDIVRGASDPRETLGAQQIKGQHASRRLKKMQSRVSKFARDLIQLQIEVMSNHFSAQTLSMISGRQMEKPVYALIKNASMRSFSIDIETDSTLQPDEQADKEARIEFLNASSNFLKTAMEATAQRPDLEPLFAEMLLFGVRGFRVGREMEDVIEGAIDQAKGMPAPAQGSQGEDAEAMAKAQEGQARLQLDAQDQAAQHQFEVRRLNQKDRELDLKERELAIKELGEQQKVVASQPQEPEAQPVAEPAPVSEIHIHNGAGKRHISVVRTPNGLEGVSEDVQQ